MVLSANTSVSQIPATLKRVQWKSGTSNVDIGCGKYPQLFTDALKEYGVTNYAIDPAWHPDWFERRSPNRAADTITVNNVFCVLPDDMHEAVIQNIQQYSNEHTIIYVLIYEGDRSGMHRTTSRGYQRNERTQLYVPYLKHHFSTVEREGNLITLRR